MRLAFPTASLRHSVFRPAFRQRPLTLTSNTYRFASSNINSTVEATQKKTQDLLASAQKNAVKFWEVTKKASGPVGEKAGQLLGAYREPLLYNVSVARELLKQIYIAEGLQPPTSISTVRAAYETLWSRARNPTYWRSILSSGEIARVGVYAVEAYAIFKVGEIIGRRHLVGYKLH